MELKPCPFCGSGARAVERHNPLSKWKWSVDCNSSLCGMSGPVESTQAGAVTAWNARVSGGVRVLASEAIRRGQAELDYSIKEQGWDAEYARAHAEVVFLPATTNT